MTPVEVINKKITHYGSDIRVISNDTEICVKGFIQPYYSKSVYDSGISGKDISIKENSLYKMVSGCEYIPKHGDVVIMADKKYVVRNSETYIWQNKPLYTWAILNLYFPPQEDDYNDN